VDERPKSPKHQSLLFIRYLGWVECAIGYQRFDSFMGRLAHVLGLVLGSGAKSFIHPV